MKYKNERQRLIEKFHKLTSRAEQLSYLMIQYIKDHSNEFDILYENSKEGAIIQVKPIHIATLLLNLYRPHDVTSFMNSVISSDSSNSSEENEVDSILKRAKLWSIKTNAPLK